MKKILIQMGVCAILAIPFLHAQEAQDLYLNNRSPLLSKPYMERKHSVNPVKFQP